MKNIMNSIKAEMLFNSYWYRWTSIVLQYCTSRFEKYVDYV